MIDTTSEYRLLIRDMPSDERPRERLRMRGPEALTNAELVAILLRTGTRGENVVNLAQRLLSQVEGLRGLGKASFGELAATKAMGAAKASQLLAAVELGKRVVNAEPAEQRVIRGASDVYGMLYADMALLEQEELRVLLLSTRNEVICQRTVYRGNVAMISVRVAEVFRDAVREGCPSIIAVHNHPSGDSTPSAEDVVLTKALLDSGKLLGIEMLDHVVIGRKDFVSMKDRKLGYA